VQDELASQEQAVSFDLAASSKGYSPKKNRGSKYQNVSHILKAKGKSGKPIYLRFDVKKSKNKKQNEDWLWIEFKNAQGESGWVHGDAHFVAFQRHEDFIIVNRKELVEWLGSSSKIRYDLPFVNLAKRAKYRIYQRNSKHEQITQIHINDLKQLKSFQLWKKKDAISA
tara:strand:+ start:46 stop:552 length:507 start_codon:yes stop_codon:yes gene_type:complete